MLLQRHCWRIVERCAISWHGEALPHHMNTCHTPERQFSMMSIRLFTIIDEYNRRTPLLAICLNGATVLRQWLSPSQVVVVVNGDINRYQYRLRRRYRERIH